MPDYSSFGALIKRLRLQRGLKQDEVASRTGIPRGSMSSIEGATYDLSKMAAIKFLAFARVLEVSPVTLGNALLEAAGQEQLTGQYQTIEIPQILTDEDLIQLYDYVSLLEMRRKQQPPNETSTDNYDEKPNIEEEDKLSNQFADWLQNQMKERGIGPNELGEKLGIDPSSILRHSGNADKHRNPTRRPTIESVWKYARFFDADPNEIAKLAGYNLPD